jgi:hypothetical protein
LDIKEISVKNKAKIVNHRPTNTTAEWNKSKMDDIDFQINNFDANEYHPLKGLGI